MKTVTVKQALLLRDLGFKEKCMQYAYSFQKDHPYIPQKPTFGVYRNKKENPSVLALPTVDEAIDWIRRKYKVIIYDASEPFVNPMSKKIIYAYKVKFCNIKMGWNHREYIGITKWSHDTYVSKREAINIALKYVIKKKNEKVIRRKNHKAWRKRISSNKSIK